MDDGQVAPPSPGSYFLPLLLVLALCGAFLYYRRRGATNLSFQSVRSSFPGQVRLSTDELPSRHEFLSNNASTDSLPADVVLPTVNPRIPPPSGPFGTINSSSPVKVRSDGPHPLGSPAPGLASGAASHGSPASRIPSAAAPQSSFRNWGRRSARRGPVEADEINTDEEDGQGGSDSYEPAAVASGVVQLYKDRTSSKPSETGGSGPPRRAAQGSVFGIGDDDSYA